MEGRVEAHQAIGWQSKFAGELYVAVAISAGIANMPGGNAGFLVGMREDPMLAMAIGAQWRLHDSGSQGFAVDTLAVLRYHIGVAHGSRSRLP